MHAFLPRTGLVYGRCAFIQHSSCFLAHITFLASSRATFVRLLGMTQDLSVPTPIARYPTPHIIQTAVKSDPQGKKSPPWIGSGTDQSGCPTEAYSDGNHNSYALSGDVNGGAATVDTMSLPLTPLVTDIQWPCWLKMGPAPKKRNGQSTWGLPRHIGGVRQSAQCPYGAAKPSWAMVRCYSRSHPPIQYTACVGFSHIKHTN